MPYQTIEMLNLGPLHLRTWGLMVGLGLLLGGLLTARLAARRGIDPEKIWTLAVVVGVTGLLGSRILWALQPAILERTVDDPLLAFRIWEGGLTFIGGIIGASIGGAVYLRRSGLPILRVADVVAPGFGLGLAIGRVGCYLTGLHPGRPTGLPWGIEYLEAIRHPIPLYESLIGLALAAAAILLLRRVHKPGIVALTIAGGYLAFRALLDLLRAVEGVSGGDPRLIGPLTLTQGVALVAVPLLLVVLGRMIVGSRRPETAETA